MSGIDLGKLLRIWQMTMNSPNLNHYFSNWSRDLKAQLATVQRTTYVSTD